MRPFLGGVAALLLAGTSSYTLANSSVCADDASSDEADGVSFLEVGRRQPGGRHKSGRQEVKLTDWRHCMGASCFLTKGPRQYMEDEFFISEDGSFFAVYDGHGGAAVSAYLREYVYGTFQEELESQLSFLGIKSFGRDIESALRNTFRKIQATIIHQPELDNIGSTAVAVVLADKYIWTLNVGDSRAVLCRNGVAVDLSRDHKPNDIKERERIEALGGEVKWYGWRDENGDPVPNMGAWRINGNLALSRSMGDHAENPYVTAEADIVKVQRSPIEDQFIVLASDGLWDVMDSQEVVDFCKSVMVGVGGNNLDESVDMAPINNKNADGHSSIRAGMERRRERIAQYLVDEALRRGTSDNTTVVCIWLR